MMNNNNTITPNPNIAHNPLGGLSERLQAMVSEPQLRQLNAMTQSAMNAVDPLPLLANIQDFLSVTLGQTLQISQGNMLDKKQELDRNNEQMTTLRELRAKMRDGAGSNTLRNFINDHGFLKNDPSLEGFADSEGSIDREKLGSAIDDAMETRNSLSGSMTFELQVLSSAVSQALSVRSAISKKASDTGDRIIGNI